MVKYLFHGSNTPGLTVLKPQISLELKPRVYATHDIRYALIRAGRQVDVIREEYMGDDKPFELAECYPDAFKQMFDCPGYIYLVKKSDFRVNPDDPDEYISTHPVKIGGCIPIKNILKSIRSWNIMEQAYDLHYYGDEAYWSGVRGGIEGYLERKLLRKQKMYEVKKEAE